MRRWFFVMILYSSGLVCLAQNNSLDSLEQVLKLEKNDTLRIKILNELAFGYVTSQPKLSKHYAEEALSLSKKSGSERGEMVSLNRLGENEFRQSNYALAVEYTTQSLKLAEQLKDTIAIAMAYRVLGNIQTFGFRNYDLALQYQLIVRKIYEKKKDPRNIVITYGNLTWIYASTNQNLQEAYQLADKGLRMAKAMNDFRLISYLYNSKGLISLQQGKLDSAKYFVELSMVNGKKINDHAVVAYNNSILGNIYLKKKDFKKAIDLFNQSSVESKELNSREILKESYLGLTKSYEGVGNFLEAYRNLNLYAQLKDSLLNWETAQKSLVTKLEFEEEKREAKITELEQANHQANKEKIIYSILFAVALISMFSVILLIARINRQRKETNLILQEKNEEIEAQNLKLKEANDIKDKFFSIIGHDLRSPLNSLKGLLGLVIRNEMSEKEFNAFAPKLHHQVVGTNETLENLLQWANAQMNGWNHSPTSMMLHHNVSKCLSLFAEAAKAKGIELINLIDEQETVHAEPNQVELIIRNLVHNAIKFSSPGGRIEIFANRRDGFTELCVKDDGIGMRPDQLENLFLKNNTKTNRGTQGERGTGLGLMLCKEMAENNGGKISVTSEPNIGTTFQVLFKTA